MKIVSAVAALRAACSTDSRPWLLLGKGPTADYATPGLLADYCVFSLGAACRIVPDDSLKAAHFADVEPLLLCAATIPATAVIILPWRPHIRQRPGHRVLPEYVKILRKEYGRQGVVAGYNAASRSAGDRNADLPVVDLHSFSATAAFDLMHLAGIRQFVSLGIDGGTEYSGQFVSAARKRRRAHASMDLLRRMADKRALSWTRLRDH